MRYCNYCSAQLPDDAIFCGSCGKKQQTATSQQLDVHPDVVNLNPNPVDVIARLMREDVHKLKTDDDILYYRSLDGNKICVCKKSSVFVYNIQNRPVALFYTISFFEQYYNDDPRQSINTKGFTFDGKTEPELDLPYNPEDGNILVRGASKFGYRQDKEGAGFITIFNYVGEECITIAWFDCLEDFFRYYKLRPMPQKEGPPMSVDQVANELQTFIEAKPTKDVGFSSIENYFKHYNLIPLPYYELEAKVRYWDALQEKVNKLLERQ
ncbi:MAG: zinc ribbon domain-containing protein [Candidatus Thermoplasmatota archaeon]